MMKNRHNSTHSRPPNALQDARAPGFLRRLAVIAYDWLLLLGVLMLAATLVVIPIQALTTINLSEGVSRLVFQLYLLSVIATYYLYFWTSGRETLGMRTWRVRLYRDDGGDLALGDALRRLLFAVITLVPAGAGLIWMLFDRDQRSWYDRLSHTRFVMRRKADKGKR